VREAIAVIRREERKNMNIKITAFFSEKSCNTQMVLLFAPGNILRFTGKFALNEEPPRGEQIQLLIITSHFHLYLLLKLKNNKK